MKTRWIIGSILFISIALNITLGAMLAGKQLQQNRQRIEIVMERISALPEAERAKARKFFLEAVPELRTQAREMRQTRKEIHRYVASDAYTRAEAEKRLADLRVKTTALQLSAQRMMLDIADQLPPEHRVKLLEQSEENMQ